jgi:hypothetical protein
LPESGLGAWCHFFDFLIFSLTQKFPESRDVVIVGFGDGSAWEDRTSWLILVLEHLSISEFLMEAWIAMPSRSEILRIQESESELEWE